jgi:hypothetical protein
MDVNPMAVDVLAAAGRVVSVMLAARAAKRREREINVRMGRCFFQLLSLGAKWV